MVKRGSSSYRYSCHIHFLANNCNFLIQIFSLYPYSRGSITLLKGQEAEKIKIIEAHARAKVDAPKEYSLLHNYLDYLPLVFKLTYLTPHSIFIAIDTVW